MAVTKQEIADYLGLSRTAVSLALNQSPKCTLSRETQERIFEAAHLLGYQMQQPVNVTKKICVALFNMESDVARSSNSVENAAVDSFLSTRGYNFVYINVLKTVQSRKRFYEYLDSGEAEGLVLFSLLDQDVLAEVARRNIPYVLFSEMGDDPVNTYYPYTFQFAKQMVHKLWEHGHRRIAYFAGSLHMPQQRSVLQGYKEALSECGLEFDPVLVQVSSIEDGGEIAERMEYLGISYTAALCSNPSIQFGALSWLRDNGVEVPKKKSLIGYGMGQLVKISVPKLTVYYVDVENYVIKGMEQLLESIQKGKKDYPARKVEAVRFFAGETLGEVPVEE